MVELYEKNRSQMMTKTYKRLPRFLVNSNGEIISKKTGSKLKTCINKYGYERISVIVGSRTDKTRRHLNLKVHRMIAETFIPNPLNLPDINHKDGNKLNNKADNLEWTNPLMNNTHARKMGLIGKYVMTAEHKKKFLDGWRYWNDNIRPYRANQKSYLHQ